MKISDLEPQIKALAENLCGNYDFTPDNVYQVGCAPNKEIIGKILDKLILPGSRIENFEAFQELRRRSAAGETCLLLIEHYSNFDFPLVYRMIEQHPGFGPDAAAQLLPIRGMKLSESTPITAVFTRSYDTIIIYPSRSLDSISDPEQLAAVRKISIPINHAAMKQMIRHKQKGRIITVFPAGTRYRSWDPDSKRGVREVHSYIKTFDNVIFLAINGNILPPHQTNDMTQDRPVKDLIILTFSGIVSGRSFRRKSEASAPPGKDTKQHVVDCVMEQLNMIHDKAEPMRLREKVLHNQAE